MRLSELVKKEIVPKMAKEYNLPILALPKLQKVTINVGIGRYKDNNDSLKDIEAQLKNIAGQSPKAAKAKKSISGFKLRKGQIAAFVVTLRGKEMWNFVEKIIKIVLPGIRDFEGINPKNFDLNNNLTMPFREQTVFPEIKPDEIKDIWGMAISFTFINGKDKTILKKYLELLGFVFIGGK